MARERAKLSDKQERILVQAQLMGLTARDMQQIGNRLIALQKEAKHRAEIQRTIEGYSWIKNDKGSWTVTTPDGYVCKFGRAVKSNKFSWENQKDYPISIAKPGTAFKTRVLQKKSVTLSDDWKAKFCPENSKELYGMIKWLSHHLHYVINQK